MYVYCARGAAATSAAPRPLEHRVPRRAVEDVVRRFSALWPVTDLAAWDRVDTCGYRFIDGKLKSDELIAELSDLTQPPRSREPHAET